LQQPAASELMAASTSAANPNRSTIGASCSSSMLETICTWQPRSRSACSVATASGRNAAWSIVARYCRSTASCAVASSIEPPRTVAMPAKAPANSSRWR
jgi:hypothetical protein